mmetsp:Transcript_86414/g.231464  ORF Transcript_86414/g.231464 Transcript_86414/m.231464 type:complete len:230 (-) Transcript_86414:2290-2979(-)
MQILKNSATALAVHWEKLRKDLLLTAIKRYIMVRTHQGLSSRLGGSTARLTCPPCATICTMHSTPLTAATNTSIQDCIVCFNFPIGDLSPLVPLRSFRSASPNASWLTHWMAMWHRNLALYKTTTTAITAPMASGGSTMQTRVKAKKVMTRACRASVSMRLASPACSFTNGMHFECATQNPEPTTACRTTLALTSGANAVSATNPVIKMSSRLTKISHHQYRGSSPMRK